jgi:hypothetical protein
MIKLSFFSCHPLVILILVVSECFLDTAVSILVSAFYNIDKSHVRVLFATASRLALGPTQPVSIAGCFLRGEVVRA